MELAEIVVELGKLVGDDKEKAKAVRKALTDLPATEGAGLVAQSLIEMGAGRRAAELQPKLTKAEADLNAANEAIAAKDEEIVALTSKAPDAAKIQADAEERSKKKLKEANDRAEAAEKRTRELNRQIARDFTISQLTTPDQAGVYVEPEHAELIMKSRYDDRFVDRDDGTLDVLQLDETTAYDGKDWKEKAKAFAADVRKRVQPRNLITSTDTGSGVRSGGGGGGYDPAKDGESRAKKQTMVAAEKNDAYR